MLALPLLVPLLIGAGLTDADLDGLDAQIRDGSRADADRAINKIAYGGGGKRMTPRLVRLLESSNASARANSAYALGIMGDPQLAAPALTLALRDDDTTVRVNAAIACGRLKLQAAGAGLTKALADKASGVRREAANAVGLIGYKAAARPLLALVSDPDLEIRATALLAVGRIGNKSAIERLHVIEKDSSETVHLGALRALAMLGDAKARADIKARLEAAEPDGRREAIGLVAEVHQEWARDLLAHKLEDTVSGVRLDAAKGLIRDNDLRGVAYLAKQADQATDPEEKLRLETALEELKVTPEIRKKALQSAAKKGPK